MGAILKSFRSMTAVLACGALMFGAAACGGDDNEGEGGSSGTGGSSEQQNVSGSIRIDGSSTVYPFAQAAAEQFMSENPGVQVSVGQAGTGGGFEKFCAGETDISNASRPIKDDEEVPLCEKSNVEYGELQVANDGIAVVTHPELQIDCFTTAQLKRLLRPNSNVSNYSDLGGDFPDAQASFFTPGEESGTFDFFTEAVLETDAEQRTEDVQTSANDNQLLTGIEGTQGALGYVGYSYAQEAGDQVNVAQIDGGNGCVAPSAQTIQDGSYEPLARPLFMYPSAEAIKKPEVRAFMDFVIQNQQRISEAAKIVPLTSQQAQEAQQALTQAESGS
jgi:phosphate transport system substrate-binding protein